MNPVYRWNKFRWGLESKLLGYVSPWERWMINKFGNCINDSNNGRFGRKEGANQTKSSDCYASNDDGSDDNDDRNGDSEEDPEEDP